MKDRQGVEMEVGMTIVYATNRGSTIYMEDAVVQQVFDDGDVKVKVGKFSKWHNPNPGRLEGWHVHQSSVYLRISDRIIILGVDNAEDIDGRDNLGPRP